MLFAQEVAQANQLFQWLWAIVTPIAIIAIGLIIEYQTGLFSNPKKEISYEIISAAPLARVDFNYSSDVKIFFKGVPVDNASSVVIKIANTGRTEIRRDDYHSPIQVIFNDDSSIIENPVVIEKQPGNLQINLELTGNNKISVAGTLLNKKDSFIFSVLMANYDNLKIEARIAGISEIKHQTIGHGSGLLYKV